MADGPTLQPKSTGQLLLPCPEMKWKWIQRAAVTPV